MIADIRQQTRGLTQHFDLGITEFVGLGTGDLAAVLLGHGLQPITDTQQRQWLLINEGWCPGRIELCDRLGSTGKNDALGRKLVEFGLGNIKGADLAEHTDLTDATRDKLGVLTTEIEHQYAVLMNILACVLN